MGLRMSGRSPGLQHAMHGEAFIARWGHQVTNGLLPCSACSRTWVSPETSLSGGPLGSVCILCVTTSLLAVDAVVTGTGSCALQVH